MCKYIICLLYVNLIEFKLNWFDLKKRKTVNSILNLKKNYLFITKFVLLHKTRCINILD